jgi:hypothetical protein
MSQSRIRRLLHVGFLLGLLFDPEYEGDISLRKVNLLPTEYTELCPRYSELNDVCSFLSVYNNWHKQLTSSLFDRNRIQWFTIHMCLFTFLIIFLFLLPYFLLLQLIYRHFSFLIYLKQKLFWRVKFLGCLRRQNSSYPPLWEAQILQKLCSLRWFVGSVICDSTDFISQLSFNTF